MNEELLFHIIKEIKNEQFKLEEVYAVYEETLKQYSLTYEDLFNLQMTDIVPSGVPGGPWNQ